MYLLAHISSGGLGGFRWLDKGDDTIIFTEFEEHANCDRVADIVHKGNHCSEHRN